MEFRETLLSAFRTLRSHKMRSALTMLGIVIGAGALVAVMSMIAGLNQAVAAQFQAIGTDIISVSKYPWVQMGDSEPFVVAASVVVVQGVSGMATDFSREFLSQNGRGSQDKGECARHPPHQRRIHHLPLSRLLPGIEGGGDAPGTHQSPQFIPDSGQDLGGRRAFFTTGHAFETSLFEPEIGMVVVFMERAERCVPSVAIGA